MRPFLIIFIFSSLLFFSCASTGFLMAKAKINLFGDPYPSKNENAPVDIYRTQKPERKYIELGEITCLDTNDDWALKQTLMKAREIGADGIIILGKGGAYSVGVPVGNTVVYSGSESYGINAIAIKYINE